MSEMTPSSIRRDLIEVAHDRIDRLESIVRSKSTHTIEDRLATVIIVAEILRDVEALVTEPLLWSRKHVLHRAIHRVTGSRDGGRLAVVIAAFAKDARRILPSLRTFDPENPPF